MKHDITRDIISDLWPLYRSGEASPAVQRMIEDFLKQDAEFRAVLETSERIEKAMPEIELSRDAELQMIQVARDRTRVAVWLIGAAIAAAVLVGVFPFILAAILFGGRL